jgi:hypothetical protein
VSFWRGLGYLLFCMMLIKVIGDGVMPQLLQQTATLGSTLSTGVQDIFAAV